MPSYRRTLPRIEWGARRTLFRYVVGDDLTLAGAVFSRASTATYVDANGVLQTAASGVARDAHYVNGERTLLLEPASTNLLLRSQEFDNASWGKTNVTVTPNAAIAPDGTLTADLVEATATAATVIVQGVVVNATACTFTVYTKRVTGDAHAARFGLYNNSTAQGLYFGSFNRGTGVFTPATGTGTWEAEALPDDWWRLTLTVTTGITSGNTVNAYPGFGGGVNPAGEGHYIWGAQLEALAVPTSYIPTEGSTVTRAADSLYFPYTALPQALTIYQRSVNRGQYVVDGNTHWMARIGSASVSTDPRLGLFSSASGQEGAQYDDGTTLVSSAGPLSTQALGDVVEQRAVFGGTTVTCGAAVNGGAEALAAESAASGESAAWSAERLYLTDGVTVIAYTHVVVASGTHTMARLRAVGSGDDLFADLLAIAYPLDEAVSFPVPQEGSQMVFVPSGEADGWDAGEMHILEGVIRWIPREDTVTPAATGWDGDAGWRAFLSWARRGNPFWYCPDASDLSTGWTMYLEGPFNEAPTIEADMTRAVRVRFRSTVPIEGY